MRDVWPETREQRDWVHRIGNVLDKLPKRLQPKAKAVLRGMMRAESREACEKEMERFQREYEAKYPKAVTALFKGKEKLLTFFDFPAEHWIHIRTSNPNEQPDRVCVLDGAATSASYEGSGLEAARVGYGIQAVGDGAGEMEATERSRSLAARASWCSVHRRSEEGAGRRDNRRSTRGERRLIIPIHNS